MSDRGDRGKRYRKDKGWGSSKFIQPVARHPHRLKGKDIGLFYKRQQARRNKNTPLTINLSIPSSVIAKLISNIQLITKLAAQQKIDIFPEKISHLFSQKASLSNISSDKKDSEVPKSSQAIAAPEAHTSQRSDVDSKTSVKTKINTNYYFDSDSTPSTSVDDIPFALDEASDTDRKDFDERVLSLRAPADFKYGYKDIITGTFKEKLNECLARGINITRQDEDIATLNLVLYEEHLNALSKSHYKKLLTFREKLPAYKKTQRVLEMVKNNQVIVISGETGCGKSTQVPQMILDDAIMKKRGGNVKILVTQPRRIAASSLASRVAQERAEALGVSVGYAVRLEKVDCRPRGSIMFCTTGVLLVDLEVNQALSDYSHIILDEVHERDTHVDFAMCMLKQVLQKRKDLKLILMSATLDAEKLCNYFNFCPMLHIEGLAYPVKDVYMEEILHLTNYQLGEEVMPQRPKNYRGRKFDRSIHEQMEKSIQYKAEIAPWLESVKKFMDSKIYRTLQNPKIEELNYDLMLELIKYICRGPPGAILVFLPGIGEITKLMSMLYDNERYLGSKCEIHPVHSKLPSLDQRRIFERPPHNVRKIVIATNIAETSITIDDIVYVIDCGKIKYSGLNVEHYFSTLKVEWASQANMRQRRGRAGRCQPGVCYHLVTTFRAAKLPERLLPEMQRNNLLEPVLMIKQLRLGNAAEALKQFPDPPEEETVKRAVKHLQQCGALDDEEKLTPLGWHLARLPVHPAAGKLLVLGALFGCLDRAASVAAVWSFKDPFLLILDKDNEIKEVKRQLAMGEPSDHMALSEAIIQWEQCDPGERKAFAYANFLSNSTLELLSEMKKQLGGNLQQMGFLNTGRVTSTFENRNYENLSLFKAIVAASLYPNITSVRWINLHARNPNKQIRVCPKSPDGPMTIHPSSLMSPPKRLPHRPLPPRTPPCLNPGANWLVYWLKQKSSDMFLIDVTLVYSLPLLFFGELNISETEQNEPNYCYVWITCYRVKMLKETAKLLFQLRSLLDQVLASKIMVRSKHSTHNSDFEEKVLNAVIEVITAEDERAEYLDGGTESDTSESDSRY
ncbi:ATP-dependent DNA/RNA helicase DHX36 isoform X1 [Ostrinia furnacalis]|uniref:ATP-dependent DNA/RNA helicase DHX36 isoform X1 n=1 Tax=Ostrinia furnacalis TaxID=93504 RepID=UPI001040828A|nr:ATP-dependent DNA/RNA helicase DHX36 isoform X1 [Ostrinia furnacalis]